MITTVQRVLRPASASNVVTCASPSQDPESSNLPTIQKVGGGGGGVTMGALAPGGSALANRSGLTLRCARPQTPGEKMLQARPPSPPRQLQFLMV